MAARPPIRLPRQCSRHVKLGILHAISLASVVVTVARGRPIGRRRLQAKLEQAESEIALFREELTIKDGRWERSQSRRRPHYYPAVSGYSAGPKLGGNPPSRTALISTRDRERESGNMGLRRNAASSESLSRRQRRATE